MFNVSMSLMRETFPEQPFRLFEVDVRKPETPDNDANQRTGHERRALERA
ncbi:MAG: hypothetical protein ACXWVT_13495 [Burkholderiaceae bacterium]